MTGEAKGGSDERAVADERFHEALDRTGARDPREFYRQRLGELRRRNPAGYRQATDYYRSVLVPGIARDGADPIAAWLDYGCLLAALTIEGTAVQIDPTGRSRPYERPVPLDHLVIHLPTSTRERALAVGLPPELSAAQKATYDLLVRGKKSGG